MRTGWGIVGWGWVARDFVAPGLTRAPNAELVAAGDDVEEVLARPEAEAIHVAAPNHAHRGLVERIAAAGRHVLCEKPMANSVEDAEAMVAACVEAGVLYATACNQRFHGAHRRLRELVAEGALGEVTQVRIHYACTAPAWWGDADWHFDPRRAGGGALWDLAPHGLDLAQLLLGEPLVEVTALRQHRVLPHPVEDGAVLTARFASDALLLQQVAYTTPETLPRRTLEVLGTEGLARATDTMGQEAGGRLELLPAADGVPREIGFAPDPDPFAAQAEAFSAAVAGDGEFPHPPERDLHTMRLLDAARRATGERVEVPAWR